MNGPAVSEAAALWRRLIAELHDRRPIISTVAGKATADSIDGFVLTVYATHLTADVLENEEVRNDIEILLSELTSHRVLVLHISRLPFITT